MRKGHVILRLTALAVVIAFGFGIVRLWMLRYDTGDIYEHYSSLRTDPLGVRAYYESLEKLPGVTVRRNFKPLKKLNRADGDTLLYLGVNKSWMPTEIEKAASQPADDRKSAARAIHEFASDGGRVVIAFTPAAGVDSFNALDDLFGDADSDKLDEDEDKKEDTKDTDDKDDEVPDAGDELYGTDRNAMGFSIGARSNDSWRELHKTPAMGTNEISIDWPDIPWRGSLYFKDLSEDWKVIYQQDNDPVIIERALGAGSIVICADSYFLSNQAVVNKKSRNPQLLAWLAGGPRVIFDETHLGQADKESVSSLAREHGLTHLFFVLLLLGGLYVWKCSVSLLPRDPEHTERFGGRDVAGKSSALGLHNLLRKCIPTGNILNECMKHWSASVSATRPEQIKDRDKIRAVIAAENGRPTKDRNTVKAYRAICQILSERLKRT